MAESNTSFNGGDGRRPPAEILADQAKQTAQDFKNSASAAAESVSHTAREEMEEVGTAAKEILGDATGKLKSAVNEQKAASADYLDSVSRAIKRAAGEFEKDVPQAATYIRRAGTQVGNVANAVRDRDIHELVSEVENLARRQPGLFFGGAVILGFAALRFLKSSNPAPVQSSMPPASVN
jgi:hypothetical protein